MNIAAAGPIGQTSVQVTPLGLGGTAFASMYSAVSEQAAADTIHAAPSRRKANATCSAAT